MRSIRWAGPAMLLAIFIGYPARASAQCPEGPRVSWRVEYLTDDAKVPQLRTRDDIHTEPQSFLELKEHVARHVCTENVLRPRYIVRKCIEYTYKPEVVTDPATGCKRHVLRPVAEEREIRTLVYDLCPEERTYSVTTFAAVPVVKDVTVKRLVPECYEQERKITHGVLLPSVCVDKEVEESKPCDAKSAPLRPEDVFPPKK